jgi:hypothetical protein
MKTTAALTIFKAHPVVLTAIAIVGLLVGRPAFAGPISVPLHTLDITENSSTSLTVIFDLTDITASAVALNSPDNWTLTFASNTQFGVFNNFWTEPEDANFVNVVFQNGPNDSNVLFVISENPNTGSAVNDGVPQQQNITVNGQGGFVSITFHDHGDAAVGVPDAGSTLMLLSLPLFALFGANRFRTGRFA